MKQAHLLTAATIVAACTLSASGCVNREAQQQAKRTEQLLSDPTLPVKVQPIRVTPLVERLEITGEVATAQDVRVAPKTPGKLAAVYVMDGDAVVAGQRLAMLDTASQQIQLRQASAQLTSAQAALSQAIANARHAPERSSAAVASAEAQLRSAKAQLDKARSGARPEEVRQAEAQARSAETAMDTARREMERQKELYEQGASSKQRYEQAVNAYEAAKAQYESARETLAIRRQQTREEDIRSAEESVRQAEASLKSAKASQELDVLLDDQVQAAQANLESARAQVNLVQQQIDDATVTSPISGRVVGIPAQPGQYVGGGESVARVVGTTGSYFEGEVPETQVGAIKVGSSVDVALDAAPGRAFRGRVAAISPRARDIGRLFSVRVQFDADPDAVKPGMFAKGQVELRKIAAAVVVPAIAVVTRAGKQYIFVVQDGTVRRTPVKLGIAEDGIVQVEGAPVGAQVVVSGQTDLDDGSKIRIETDEAAPKTAAKGN